MSAPITVMLGEHEMQLAFTTVAGHVQALKNWIVSAVEAEEFQRAKALTKELKEYRDLFAKLNVEAKKQIAAAKPKINVDASTQPYTL